MRGVESIGAGESAARDAKGPDSFHVKLYDALAALALNADGVHLG
jgi:hydroxyethylthiazole kinase-like sugar kinase family protein